MNRLKVVLCMLCAASASLDAATPDQDQLLFGTTHGHTNWSIDAFGIGNQSLGSKVDHDVALGDAVTHHTDSKVKLQRQQYYALPNRAEMMGIVLGLIKASGLVHIGQWVASVGLGKAIAIDTHDCRCRR
ncbi:hypothetical protein A3709_04565 [Halioglobus sp. HI00S01]|uniref:DUF3604 domain-containing protein n=1 Tax=Halioglobus sp. HI00S01 TaxID=1822214 RepID=UPI0007C24888|nr:DUF3604 domain-containing protein [Halioglobus sp. HI00S01]KZX57048.1 hypothetical protein A3709_04565 [Halioglobus sp. HI00S01]